MVWVRLDDHIDEHPKIAQLDDHAFALFVCGLAYCNRNVTSGFIPSMVGLGQLRFCDGNPAPAIRQLERVGLWVQLEGGWQVHDYDQYQPTAESVAAEHAAKVAAGAAGGRASAQARAQAKAQRLLEQVVKQNPSPDPVPLSTSTGAVAAAVTPEPELSRARTHEPPSSLVAEHQRYVARERALKGAAAATAS